MFQYHFTVSLWVPEQPQKKYKSTLLRLSPVFFYVDNSYLGEGGLAIYDYFWRKWKRVRHILTISYKGGRGGPDTPNFGWRHLWTVPNEVTRM